MPNSHKLNVTIEEQLGMGDEPRHTAAAMARRTGKGLRPASTAASDEGFRADRLTEEEILGGFDPHATT